MDGTFWGVAQVKPGAANMAVGDLREKGFDVFAPVVLTRKVLHRGRKTRVVDVRAPLFCGYVFVGWPEIGGEWVGAAHARGVLDLLRRGGRLDAPARVRPSVMDGLLAAGEIIDLTNKSKAVAFRVGEDVEIAVGALSGRRGRIVWLDERRQINCMLELTVLAAEFAGFRMRATVDDLRKVVA